MNVARRLRALAPAAVAVTGRLLWAGLSAMEVTLFTSLTLGAVWLYQRRGLGVGTAVLFGLASQARPEGHVLFALVMLDAFISTRWQYRARQPVATWRIIFLTVAIYGLIQLPYALFSLSVTGKPLPNTFNAKSRTTTFYSWRTFRETWGYHWRDNLVSLLLLPFGLAYLWRHSRKTVAWLLGLLLIMPIIVPIVWHHGRYTMPLLPFQMMSGQRVCCGWGKSCRAWPGQLGLRLVCCFCWLARGGCPPGPRCWATTAARFRKLMSSWANGWRLTSRLTSRLALTTLGPSCF